MYRVEQILLLHISTRLADGCWPVNPRLTETLDPTHAGLLRIENLEIVCDLRFVGCFRIPKAVVIASYNAHNIEYA